MGNEDVVLENRKTKTTSWKRKRGKK